MLVLDNPIYTYRGKRYEIIREKTDSPSQPNRAEGLLRDFKWCEEKGDWDTISNRITNGLKWGWMIELAEEREEFFKEVEEPEVVTINQNQTPKNPFF